MNSLIKKGAINLGKACVAVGLALATVSPSSALVILTSDPSVAEAFQAGATVESFDDLTAFLITSYEAGQTIDAGAKFSSRDGATQPTYHSGGASPGDPVGNPGSPIGIFAPEGGIAGDVVSGSNVAGPLVIFTDEPFNNGFMEVILPSEASLIGFWVTHGTVNLSLRDVSGLDLTTGDFSATVSAGQFVGITRDNADVKVAALIAQGTDAFTIDNFTFGAAGAPPSELPEAGSLLTLVLAAGFLGFAKRKLKR